jgi:hypothetical protein
MKRQKGQQLTLGEKENIAQELCHKMDTAAEQVSSMHAHTLSHACRHCCQHVTVVLYMHQ